MAYQVLARKYRPQRFSDVVGQDHVTRTLINALTQNRLAHGYIFSGHRGIGKTTIARILAMALDCRTEVGSAARPTVEPCLACISCTEISSGGNASGDTQATHSFDFIEIDAASNRGIDDVRSICAQASVRPARDRYKIFLLDEAHQITDAAFNAILKTLEEPPDWAIFMMATTEPESIPQTIRSRCQHFSFHAVKFDDIVTQLRLIATREQIDADDETLALLAEAGDGSMRDALSIMDQAIASAPLTDGRPVLQVEQIRGLMGSVPNAVFETLLESVSSADSAGLMDHLNRLLNAGNSSSAIARQMVRYLRNCLMSKIGGEKTQLLEVAQDERARAARTALLFTEEEITRNLQIMLRTFDELNYRQEQRFHLELGVLKLAHAQRLLPVEELLSGIAQASRRPSGSAAGPPAAGPSPRSASSSANRTTADSPGSAATPTSSVASTSPARSASSARSADSASPKAVPPLSPFAATLPAAGRPVESATSPRLETEGALALSNLIEMVPVASTPVTPASVATATAATTAAAPSKLAQPTVLPMVSAIAAATLENTTASAPSTPAPAAQPAAQPAVDNLENGTALDALRAAVAAALEEEGHSSAASLMASGRWRQESTSLRIEVATRSAMIRITFNSEAEKIMRRVLAQHSAPSRFAIVPGEGLSAVAPARTNAPTGSVEGEARNHPLVTRAAELFDAEIISVIDLRPRD